MSDFASAGDWTRDLLNKTEEELPDDKLDRWMQSAVDKLAQEWPDLPAYDDLEEADLRAMDECLGCLVAAKIRPMEGVTEPTTDIIRIHTLNTHFQFSDPGQERKTLIERWLDQGYEALRRVSVIAAVWTQLQAVELFQAAGPRRAQEARGVNTHGFGNPLYTILADEWDYEQQHPQTIGLSGWVQD